MADKNGGFWLGYASGKLVHYAAGNTLEYDLLQTIEGQNGSNVLFTINGLAIDQKGHVWVGGYGTDGISYTKYPGLYRFDGTTWTANSESDGLLSDRVTALKADETGNIWIGTDKGLSQLILFSETVTVSTSHISCFEGNNGAIILTPEGSNKPYQFSIDGGKTLVSEKSFSGLTAGNYHVLVKDSKGHTAHDELITLTQPAGEFTWKVTPVSCAGAKDGAIGLAIQNDGAQTTYSWHDAAGNRIASTKDVEALAGGTYSVTVTYGDCVLTKTMVVPEPSPLQASLEHLNSCGDAVSGQITVRITSGTAPFKFSIDGGATFQQENIFSNLAAGSYQVIVRDASNCSFTTAPLTINQQEKPVPVVTSTGSLTLCAGNSVWLKTAQKYEAYAWYDSNDKFLSSRDSLEVSQAGTYYVVVYQDQCQGVSNKVSTTMVATFDQQTVCIVTVDAATGKNKIFWEKLADRHIASYNIYKETGTNQYSLIGNVPYDSANFFIDGGSAPMMASERYSIAIVDICGRESAKSPAHKTIYLQANLGVNNSVNLSWDNYEGFTYTQVNVLRGASVSNLQLLATRPANNNTFTDTSPNSAEMVYVIEAVTDYSCQGYSGRVALENQRVAQENAFTRSNPSSTKRVLGIAEDLIASAGLKIFPNPSDADITVEVRNGKFIHQVRLIDLTGRVVQEVYLKKGMRTVLLERKAKAGVYILEVTDGQAQVYRQRVILKY